MATTIESRTYTMNTANGMRTVHVFKSVTVGRKWITTIEKKDICPRCGGQGKLDEWVYTGSYCFKCGGSGNGVSSWKTKRPTPEYEKVLEAEREKELNRTILIAVGNTFEIKEQLKNEGFKWDADYKFWYTEADNCEICETIPAIYRDRAETFRNYKEGQNRLKNADTNDKVDASNFEPKQKIEIAVDTCKCVWSGKSGYGYNGYTYIVIFKDVNGIEYKYSGSCLYNEQDGIKKMRATVKEVTEYNGKKQVVIQRIKLLEADSLCE